MYLLTPDYLIKNYPFTKISQSPFARPILNIELTNPHTSLSVVTPAVIDTGADECAIPVRLAECLGHNLTSGLKTKTILTGNGRTIVYSHTFEIKILDLTGTKVLYTAKTPIDVFPNLHCALLGVNNFLNAFCLTVNYPKQVFSLQKQ